MRILFMKACGHRIHRLSVSLRPVVMPDGKEGRKMKKESKKRRKRKYDENRDTFFSADGKYYCYKYWNPAEECVVTQKLEIGKDLTMDLTLFLEESDYDMDLNDDKQDALQDPLFKSNVQQHYANCGNENTVDPWDKLANRRDSVEAVLFPEPENPEIALVRHVIDEECTEAQKDLFYMHFGMKIQLETIRQAEAARTGKLVSNAAFNNRKNKILNKVAKALGTERAKRQGYTRKTDQ